jgi:hypothetical protein
MSTRIRSATVAPVGRRVPIGYVIVDGVRSSAVTLKEGET